MQKSESKLSLIKKLSGISGKFVLFNAVLFIVISQIPVKLIAQPPSTPVAAMATTDGVVHAVVRSGNTLYIGGTFGLVRNPDNSFELRNKIAAIDITTGYVTSWNPGSDGPVLAMAISGNTLFAGGQFTNIGGHARNNIAALDITTNTYNASDWNPNANGDVSKIIVSGTTIYVSGSFSNIGGASRNKIASLTTMINTNNALAWDPQPDGQVNDMVLSGTYMYVCGTFTFIGGKVRNSVACISTTTDVNNATDWDPNANDYVTAISYLGNTLYAVGNFTTIGGQQRVRIAALNMLTNTNNATAWNPAVNGRISTMKAFDGRIYIGGSFSSAGGQTRNYIASLDASINTNNTTSWNPLLNDIVEKINIVDSAVFISGNFTTVNGNAKSFFAEFKPVLPTLTTTQPFSITINSAQSGGNVTADGGPAVIVRGVCWSLNSNPTIDDNKTINGSGSGTFTSSISSLDIYTLYHIRAYATNSIGTAYGNDISFTTLPAIYTGSLMTGQFCAGDSLAIPFTVTPGFENNNWFIAELSDALGTFQNPVKLDSVEGKESGDIHSIIPRDTHYGINYRFRVISTQEGMSLSDNGNDIQVNELPEVSFIPIPSVCTDHPLMDLTGGTPPGGTYSGKGVLNNQFNAAVAGAGYHIITYSYSDGFGCTNRASTTITVNPLPLVQLSLQTDICIDATPLILDGGIPQGGTYFGTGVESNTFNPNTAGAGRHTITYTFADSNGCVNSASKDINVNPLPIVTLDDFKGVCLNSPSFELSGGKPTGGVYTGTGVLNNIFEPSAAGVGTHIIQYTYTDSLGCSDNTTKNLTVYSLPPKPVITQINPRTITSSSVEGNQWYFNDEMINGANGKDLNPAKNGNYTVQVTDSNGCVSEMSDIFNVHSLNVSFKNNKISIEIFPNPAGDYLFVKFDYDYTIPVNLIITDLLGANVIQKSIYTDEKIIKINTTNLSSGVYLLIITQGETKFVKRIIVCKNN